MTVSDLTDGKNHIRGSHPLLPPNEYRGLGVELFTEHYLHVKEALLQRSQRGRVQLVGGRQSAPHGLDSRRAHPLLREEGSGGRAL